MLGLWHEVLNGGVVAALFGAPSESAAGLVVVPREHAGAAVSGEDGREKRGRWGLVRAALAVGDRHGAGAGPMLAHGVNVGAFGHFLGRRGDVDTCTREQAPPTLSGGLLRCLLHEERGPLRTALAHCQASGHGRGGGNVGKTDDGGWSSPRRFRRGLSRGLRGQSGRDKFSDRLDLSVWVHE